MPENTAAPSRQSSSAPGQPQSRLDSFFKISARGSTVGSEVRGGLATFFAMSYIVVLNPLILGTLADANGSQLGIVPVAAVTALVAGVMTLLMGVVANQPFAMAAGLGVNAFLAATMATAKNLTWPELMGLVVWAGIIMFVLVLTGFRTAVFNAVPQSLKTAIVVGIGLFIAFIGFVDSGFIRRIPDAAGTTVPVGLGLDNEVIGWPMLTFVIGLFLIVFLMVRNIRGSILIGVVVTTIISILFETFFPSGSSVQNPRGWSLVVPGLPEHWVGLPDLSLLGHVDLVGAFGSLGGMAASLLVFAILLSVFFDAMGTSIGVATEAGTIDREGNVAGINRVLAVDALGSVAGGFGSGSANQIFVESATGAAEGARTGLANIVTGALFLVAMFVSPLVNIVPFEAVAPALVIVGFLMVRQAVNIEWNDWGLGIPAFLTMAMMPFTYSIADGIGAGFVSFTFIRVVQGRAKEVHPLMYLVSAAFVLYFGMGVIQGWMG